MNLPSQKAWASLFWEWAILQEDYNMPCHGTHMNNGREIANCTHMTYNPDLGGSFEGYDCPLHKIIIGKDPDEACLARYQWLQDYCSDWNELLTSFWRYLDEIIEGEQR